MSDAASSVGGDFGCCKGEAGSVAASPVVQLREALADAERPVWHPHTAGSLVSAARAALEWMSEEPQRLSEAWESGYRNGYDAGPDDVFDLRLDPYRWEGTPNDD